MQLASMSLGRRSTTSWLVEAMAAEVAELNLNRAMGGLHWLDTVILVETFATRSGFRQRHARRGRHVASMLRRQDRIVAREGPLVARLRSARDESFAKRIDAVRADDLTISSPPLDRDP